MRAFPLPLRLALLAVAFAAPGALADAAYDGGAPLGDASVHLALEGAPLLAAATPLALRATTDAEGALEARLVAQDGAAGGWFALREEGRSHVATVVFPTEGRWSVEVRRTDAEPARFAVDVWPPAGAFVETRGAAHVGIVLAGSAPPLAFRLVDAAGHPVPAQDARVVVEGPEGTRTLPLVPREGWLTLEETWHAPGEHRLHVVSEQARLAQGARPPVPLLVVDTSEAEVYGLAPKETPMPALVAPLAALAAVALLARRR